MRTVRSVIVVLSVAAGGCREMCLTDLCRAQFAGNSPAPAARPITPEPSTRTVDGLRVSQSTDELRELLRESNEALARTKAAIDAIEARQNALLEQLKREAVWRTCDEPHPKCGLIAATMGSHEFIAEFSRSECKEPFSKSRKNLSRTCTEKYDALFIGALSERYPLADAAAVNRECSETPACKGMESYELLCLQSHNAELVRRYDTLNAPFQRERDRRVQMYAEQLDDVAERNKRIIKAFEEAQEQRAQRARDLEQLRAEQQAQEERQRDEAQRRATMAAALRAVGTSLQTGAHALYSPSAVSAAPGCARDYECGIGRRCVKPANEMSGVCMTAVNQTGVQSFAPPDPGSLGPGQRQCWTMAECPVGFRCESGQCLR